MNGIIKRGMAVLSLAGLTALGGCCKDFKFCDYYDNCWPERYSFQASQSVNHAFAAQANNGHVLDQTVFSYHFEVGTDKLTKGGQEHLAYLARRRPQPDTNIYLQNAQDVTYDPAAPEQVGKDRADLNARRVQAIQRFLNADTAGRPMTFNVLVHDAPTPGMPAQPIGIAVQRHYNSYQGVLPLGTTGGTGGGVGAAGGSGSGGNGGGMPR